MLDLKTSPWLLDLLSFMHGRLGMYLGSEEVRTLSAFLMGYRAARIDLGAPAASEEEDALLGDFTRWLKVRFHDDRDVSWETIIEDRFMRAPTTSKARRRRSPTDGSAKLFFDLFEQYLAGVQLGYSKIDLSDVHAGGIFRPRRERTPLPVPELVGCEGGARARIWKVQVAKQVPVDCARSAAAMEARAQELYRQNLHHDSLDHHAVTITLGVSLRRLLPRTLEVRVVRGGVGPDWEVAADTLVMVAVEEKFGRITKLQGVLREEWKRWPLPPVGGAG